MLGPNGAGKTTTLRMISTLIKPDSGDVLVDGYSITNEPHDVRSRIGFLTSELKYEDFLSILNVKNSNKDVRFNQINDLLEEFEKFNISLNIKVY